MGSARGAYLIHAAARHKQCQKLNEEFGAYVLGQHIPVLRAVREQTLHTQRLEHRRASRVDRSRYRAELVIDSESVVELAQPALLQATGGRVSGERRGCRGAETLSPRRSDDTPIDESIEHVEIRQRRGNGLENHLGDGTQRRPLAAAPEHLPARPCSTSRRRAELQIEYLDVLLCRCVIEGILHKG
jgi:hypothetical protein